MQLIREERDLLEFPGYGMMIKSRAIPNCPSVFIGMAAR
jgi:hypothetical protein